MGREQFLVKSGYQTILDRVGVGSNFFVESGQEVILNRVRVGNKSW